MPKALIAMSGGVDSSVSAKLTKDMGFDCIGCTMKLYDNDDIGLQKEKTCCTLDDVEDARSVAFRLGMPYHVFNFKDDFHENVISRFIKSYEEGITPNPCIDCNRYMKFDKLYERGRILGCDYIVTGHYAQIEKQGDRFVLKKAADPTKDQSYVLYSLTQEQLSHTLFPLGGMPKSEARSIAEQNGFINAHKADSQDICFVPDGDYCSFIEKTTGRKYPEGNFINTKGEVLGRHKGIVHYTIGQRKGLGISSSEPLYVKSINIDDNTVTLCSNEELFTTTLTTKDMNWTSGEAPTESFRCKVKIRYRHTEQPATVIPLDATSIRVEFDEPQRAITPGQSAVLYDGDIVLGGGKIILE